jgi:uncharacterized iron-regulated membrane protein
MIACFTGAILVFEEELQHSLHKERYFVKEQKELQLPVAEVTAGIKQQLPDAKITGVKIYSDPTRNLEYAVTLPEVKTADAPKAEGKKVTAFVDPYSGKLIELYTYGDSYFYTIISCRLYMAVRKGRYHSQNTQIAQQWCILFFHFEVLLCVKTL